jgi:hypothetical protein
MQVESATYLALPLPTRHAGAADAPPLLVAVVAGVLFALAASLGGGVVWQAARWHARGDVHLEQVAGRGCRGVTRRLTRAPAASVVVGSSKEAEGYTRVEQREKCRQHAERHEEGMRYSAGAPHCGSWGCDVWRWDLPRRDWSVLSFINMTERARLRAKEGSTRSALRVF